VPGPEIGRRGTQVLGRRASDRHPDDLLLGLAQLRDGQGERDQVADEPQGSQVPIATRLSNQRKSPRGDTQAVSSARARRKTAERRCRKRRRRNGALCCW
jgi:hypothetical protein